MVCGASVQARRYALKGCWPERTNARVIGSRYLFSHLKRERLPMVVHAALKGLNTTARGNAPGTERGHESKP